MFFLGIDLAIVIIWTAIRFYLFMIYWVVVLCVKLAWRMHVLYIKCMSAVVDEGGGREKITSIASTVYNSLPVLLTTTTAGPSSSSTSTFTVSHSHGPRSFPVLALAACFEAVDALRRRVELATVDDEELIAMLIAAVNERDLLSDLRVAWPGRMMPLFGSHAVTSERMHVTPAVLPIENDTAHRPAKQELEPAAASTPRVDAMDVVNDSLKRLDELYKSTLKPHSPSPELTIIEQPSQSVKKEESSGTRNTVAKDTAEKGAKSPSTTIDLSLDDLFEENEGSSKGKEEPPSKKKKLETAEKEENGEERRKREERRRDEERRREGERKKEEEKKKDEEKRREGERKREEEKKKEEERKRQEEKKEKEKRREDEKEEKRKRKEEERRKRKESEAKKNPPGGEDEFLDDSQSTVTTSSAATPENGCETPSPRSNIITRKPKRCSCAKPFPSLDEINEKHAASYRTLDRLGKSSKDLEKGAIVATVRNGRWVRARVNHISDDGLFLGVETGGGGFSGRIKDCTGCEHVNSIVAIEKK